MTNPYAPPTSEAEVLGAPIARAQKPTRVLVFQALLMLQVVTSSVATYSALQMVDVWTLPVAALTYGLWRPLVGVPVMLMLIVALQRRGPKPGLVAPVLATAWWLLSASAMLTASPMWLVGVGTNVLLLYFALSIWLHRKTRAYLEQQ